MDRQALIEAVRVAGVVGAGGAGFPTWRKLAGCGPIRRLVVNGAACEPLLTADAHCLSRYGDRVLDGAEAVRAALGAEEIVLAVKGGRPGLRRAMAPWWAGRKRLRWHELADVYPAGDEHLLALSVTGRAVPEGGRPTDVGVLVQNTQTLAWVGEALVGRPVTRRFVSVTGAVRRPLSFEADLGTPLGDLIAAAGGAVDPSPAILAGGVMMGRLADPAEGLAKTTSGLVVLPADHPAVQERLQDLGRAAQVADSVCDGCYACTEMCPRQLAGHRVDPHRLMRAARRSLADPGSVGAHVHLCCECGVCSLLACPLRITPRRLIAALKRGAPAWGGPCPPARPPHPDRDSKQMPLAALKRRLALDAFPDETPFQGPLSGSVRLNLPLGEFGGGEMAPLVRPGDRVVAGEVVAQGRQDRLHAPRAGRVESVTAGLRIRVVD